MKIKGQSPKTSSQHLARSLSRRSTRPTNTGAIKAPTLFFAEQQCQQSQPSIAFGRTSATTQPRVPNPVDTRLAAPQEQGKSAFSCSTQGAFRWQGGQWFQGRFRA